MAISKEKMDDYLKKAKRANTRIKALEVNNLSDYNTAYNYLESRGRKRFLEGKNFENEAIFERAYKEVNYFLESATTVKEAKQLAKTEQNYQEKKIELNYNKLKRMGRTEKENLSRKLAQKANGRIRTLRKNDINYYAMEHVNYFLDQQGRENFYTGRNFESEEELNRQLYELTNFLNSKSSTMTGLKEVRNKRINTLSSKYNIDISTKQKEKLFFEFLSSEQFKQLCKYADSEDILDDVSAAMQDGEGISQIQEEYQDFLINNQDMTFEQIAERRTGKKEFH